VRSANFVSFVNLMNAMPPIHWTVRRHPHDRHDGNRDFDDFVPVIASPEVRWVVAIAIEAATAVRLGRRRTQSQER
jgi:hypothetical protein